MGKRTRDENNKIAEYAIKHGNRVASLEFNLSYYTIKGIRSRYRGNEIKRIASLTPEMVAKIRSKAIMIARRGNFGDYADDFASYAVLKRVEGLRTGTNHLDYDLIDFKRETFGDNRKTIGRTKSQAYFTQASLEDQEIVQPEKIELDWGYYAGQFKDNERAILLLHYRFGFTQTECGYLFGFSESRACQILTIIISKIKKHKGTIDL